MTRGVVTIDSGVIVFALFIAAVLTVAAFYYKCGRCLAEWRRRRIEKSEERKS